MHYLFQYIASEIILLKFNISSSKSLPSSTRIEPENIFLPMDNNFKLLSPDKNQGTEPENQIPSRLSTRNAFKRLKYKCSNPPRSDSPSLFLEGRGRERNNIKKLWVITFSPHELPKNARCPMNYQLDQNRVFNYQRQPFSPLPSVRGVKINSQRVT